MWACLATISSAERMLLKGVDRLALGTAVGNRAQCSPPDSRGGSRACEIAKLTHLPFIRLLTSLRPQVAHDAQVQLPARFALLRLRFYKIRQRTTRLMSCGPAAQALAE